MQREEFKKQLGITLLCILGMALLSLIPYPLLNGSVYENLGLRHIELFQLGVLSRYTLGGAALLTLLASRGYQRFMVRDDENVPEVAYVVGLSLIISFFRLLGDQFHYDVYAWIQLVSMLGCIVFQALGSYLIYLLYKLNNEKGWVRRMTPFVVGKTGLSLITLTWAEGNKALHGILVIGCFIILMIGFYIDYRQDVFHTYEPYVSKLEPVAWLYLILLEIEAWGGFYHFEQPLIVMGIAVILIGIYLRSSYLIGLVLGFLYLLTWLYGFSQAQLHLPMLGWLICLGMLVEALYRYTYRQRLFKLEQSRW